MMPPAAGATAPDHPILDRIRRCSADPEIAVNFFAFMLYPNADSRMTFNEAKGHNWLAATFQALPEVLSDMPICCDASSMTDSGAASSSFSINCTALSCGSSEAIGSSEAVGSSVASGSSLAGSYAQALADEILADMGPAQSVHSSVTDTSSSTQSSSTHSSCSGCSAVSSSTTGTSSSTYSSCSAGSGGCSAVSSELRVGSQHLDASVSHNLTAGNFLSQSATSAILSPGSQRQPRPKLLQMAHLDKPRAADKVKGFCKQVWQAAKLPQAIQTAQQVMLYLLKRAASGLPLDGPISHSQDVSKQPQQQPLLVSGPEQTVVHLTTDGSAHALPAQGTAADVGATAQPKHSLG